MSVAGIGDKQLALVAVQGGGHRPLDDIEDRVFAVSHLEGSKDGGVELTLRELDAEATLCGLGSVRRFIDLAAQRLYRYEPQDRATNQREERGIDESLPDKVQIQRQKAEECHDRELDDRHDDHDLEHE